jgi:hypothetical protein
LMPRKRNSGPEKVVHERSDFIRRRIEREMSGSHWLSP